ncbi:MAG: hypothetical protein ACJAV1_003400 [Paraglaciecola sp.]|jgi:hypothetical protein
MQKHSVTASQINAANLFLQISFPVLYSPLLVSVEKTSISSIRNTEEFTQWKLINPDIDYNSCLDIAIAQIIKSPTYFARLFFTAKFELPQIDLSGNNQSQLPASSLQELTSRLEVLKTNRVWTADFSKALTAIYQNNAVKYN